MIGNFRSPKPDIRIRKDFRKIGKKFFHGVDIPDICGDPDGVGSLVTDVGKCIVDRVIDRRFIKRRRAEINAVGHGTKGVHGGIGMYVFCIDRDKKEIHKLTPL